MKRDGINKEDALNKINSKLSLEEKRMLSDYIVDNSKDLKESFKIIDHLIYKLKPPKTYTFIYPAIFYGSLFPLFFLLFKYFYK